MTAAIAKLESEGKKVSQSLRDVLTDAEQTRDRMKEMAESVDETSEVQDTNFSRGRVLDPHRQVGALFVNPAPVLGAMEPS